MSETKQYVELPAPKLHGTRSVEDVLQHRRSVREYAEAPLALSDIAQLLWAAQGITGNHGLRTAPSAGALYPLEVYVVVGTVQGLAPGVYRYQPDTHRLRRTADGDRRATLARVALGQTWMREGAATLVFTAVYERTTFKYGRRGVRYVHMEVGHAAQNVFLQATALGLATVVVGAFHDKDVQQVLELDPNEHPLSIMPIGKP